jgi:hypothetical protein
MRYYFVCYFVTYTNHLLSFCSVLTVLTTIQNKVKEEEDEDEEGESYKGEAESNDGKSIGSFVCEGP